MSIMLALCFSHKAYVYWCNFLLLIVCWEFLIMKDWGILTIFFCIHRDHLTFLFILLRWSMIQISFSILNISYITQLNSFSHGACAFKVAVWFNFLAFCWKFASVFIWITHLWFFYACSVFGSEVKKILRL